MQEELYSKRSELEVTERSLQEQQAEVTSLTESLVAANNLVVERTAAVSNYNLNSSLPLKCCNTTIVASQIVTGGFSTDAVEEDASGNGAGEGQVSPVGTACGRVVQ
jgi:hypothetical protein